MRFLKVLAVVIGLVLVAADARAEPYETVVIADSDPPLSAYLFRPKGAGPFPAVVGLHGCGGLGNRRTAIDARPRDWGERLAAAGYAVLFPDSFGSRGAGSQCGERDRRIRPRIERRRDAEAARRWLQSQPWVKANEVFLIGWSHGGSTVLWSVRPQAAPQEKTPDFRAAIAFYPGCRAPAARGWTARLPTLVLIGEADDWTPAPPCQAMVTAARASPAPVEIVTYPGAHHGFDHPRLPLRQRTGLAFAPEGRAHVGTDPSARADAIRRVEEWLKR